MCSVAVDLRSILSFGAGSPFELRLKPNPSLDGDAWVRNDQHPAKLRNVRGV